LTVSEVPSSVLAAISRLVSTLAEAGPRATLELLDLEIETVLGHSYITVSVREKDNLVRRIYSAEPGIYPEGQLKDLVRNERTRRLLHEGVPYLANSWEELSVQYVDPEVLAENGVTSLANIPLRFDGEVIGVLNIADTGGPRPEGFLVSAQAFGDFLAPLVLLWKHSSELPDANSSNSGSH